MDVRCGDRSVAESHTQLMQICHDVPCRVKAADGRPLMVINFEIAVLGGGGSKPSGKIGANDATERRVESVHFVGVPQLRHNCDCVFGRLPDLFQVSDNPHIRFCKLFLPVRILGFNGQEERNVFGVCTQEESFLAASLDITHHAHSMVDGFIAVADWAEPDDLRRAVRPLTFNWGSLIDEPCC